jgi:hypothetical protein
VGVKQELTDWKLTQGNSSISRKEQKATLDEAGRMSVRLYDLAGKCEVCFISPSSLPAVLLGQVLGLADPSPRFPFATSPSPVVHSRDPDPLPPRRELIGRDEAVDVAGCDGEGGAG